MMLQPEFPFAYRWDLPATPETRRAALEQWEAVIRLNRNHPSIVSWCMGNEQYDSFDIAGEMYQAAKRLDPTRPVIDSDGCGFKHKDRKTLDYLVVQFGEAHSIGYQDHKYDIPATITKPVIGHEMGYFATLHDLAQIDRFQNGLRPYWLLQTRDLAKKNGLFDVYPDWLSGLLPPPGDLFEEQHGSRASLPSGRHVGLAFPRLSQLRRGRGEHVRAEQGTFGRGISEIQRADRSAARRAATELVEGRNRRDDDLSSRASRMNPRTRPRSAGNSRTETKPSRKARKVGSPSAPAKCSSFPRSQTRTTETRPRRQAHAPGRTRRRQRPNR